MSQFTLYADIKSRLPGFTKAAPGGGHPPVRDLPGPLPGPGVPGEHGQFGADMAVASVNDGPVTIWMDTDAM